MEAERKAATTETTRFCPMCAAPRRPRTAFCHRCGKPFPEESAVVYKTNDSAPETQELAGQNGEIATNNHIVAKPETAVENESIKVETVSKTETATDFTQTLSEIEKPAEKSETVPAKLPEQTRRVKRRVVQTTEYVWEESAADPTWRLALATILILIFLFLVLWFGRFINF